MVTVSMEAVLPRSAPMRRTVCFVRSHTLSQFKTVCLKLQKYTVKAFIYSCIYRQRANHNVQQGHKGIVCIRTFRK